MSESVNLELLAVLEEIIDYRGGADNALADDYVVGRARDAIARAQAAQPAEPAEKIDAFSEHEALHVASLCTRLVDEELLSHAYIAEHPDLKHFAEKACDALADLYQAIGSKKSWGSSAPPNLPTKDEVMRLWAND